MQRNKRTTGRRPVQHSTGWQSASKWYNKIVGTQGHYYHEHVVLPGLIKLLKLDAQSSVLDIGCGQGVLARRIPEVAEYLGVDLSASLIESAQLRNHAEHFSFVVADATKAINAKPNHYTHAVFVLSLQNMADPTKAITHAVRALQPGGSITLVLNHPCFRIPRQSGWEVDAKTKQQFRWINRYNSWLKIPITTHPGQKNSSMTWSFHHNLTDITHMLFANKCHITAFQEWSSDKESEGKAARMENRARSEFPLFLAIQAVKQS